MSTIFVAKDGNDSNDGAKATPKLTISGAKAIAVDGDQIVLLDPHGEWFESHSSGTMTFGISSASLGLDIKSWDPRRPARIGGTTGSSSINILESAVRFHNVDLCTGSDSTLSIVQATASKTGLEFYGCNFVPLHDIDTIGGYAINCAQSGLVLEDCEVVQNARSLLGFFLNGDGVRMRNVKAMLRSRLDSATSGSCGVRIHSGARNLEFLDCKFGGAWGIRHSAASTASTQFRLVRCELYGVDAQAAVFAGASSGTLTVISRDNVFFGSQGCLVAGSDCILDEHGSKSYSGNVSLGAPTDGAYTNVRGLISDHEATCWDTAVGHTALFGNGSTNSEVRRLKSLGRSAAYGSVFKGTGKIHDSYIEGGSQDTVLYKGGAGWEMKNLEVVQNAGGTALDVRNGDSTPIASDLDFQYSTFVVTDGELFDIGATPAQHDDTLVLDNNTYVVDSGASWGTIEGTSVTSLSEVQAAWDQDANSGDSTASSTKAAIRSAINGTWTDENDNAFDLTVTDAG
jgi:hypothetical protein